MIKVLFFFFLWLSKGLCDPFHIAIVSWNGHTEVEYSFLKTLQKYKIHFEFKQYDCHGNKERCHSLVPVLRQEKPDLILLWGTPACLSLAGTINDNPKEYITDIPIIATLITDPFAVNITAKPDFYYRKNILCLQHVPPVHVQWNIIKLYDRTIKKIAAFYSEDEAQSKQQIISLQHIAKKEHAVVIPFPLIKNHDLTEFLQTCLDEKIDMIYLPSDTYVSLYAKQIVDFATQHHIPTFTTTESMYWETEPFLGFITRFHHVGEDAAHQAFEILVNQSTFDDIQRKEKPKYSLILSEKTTRTGKFIPPLEILKIALVI